jgi:hypothetical protein
VRASSSEAHVRWYKNGGKEVRQTYSKSNVGKDVHKKSHKRWSEKLSSKAYIGTYNKEYSQSEAGIAARKRFNDGTKETRAQLLYDLSDNGKCTIGCGRPATEIDHMLPEKKIRNLSQCNSYNQILVELKANTQDNILYLRSVCEPCHAAITAETSSR